MIFLSFFLILLGTTTFIASLIGLVYRLVSIGQVDKNDSITRRRAKFCLGGLGLVLLAQIVIWLAM